jgi:hypothetical protein
MSATDLAAVLVALASLVAVGVLSVASLSLLRTMRELRGIVDHLRTETVPLVTSLHDTVRQAGDDLDRVEGVLASAERIATTVDSASRLTYRALSPPLIRTLSVVAGARRAGARLRGRGDTATAVEARGELVAGPRRRRRRRRA